jgi:hypothetical protein
LCAAAVCPSDLRVEARTRLVLMLFAMTLAVRRFRTPLD